METLHNSEYYIFKIEQDPAAAAQIIMTAAADEDISTDDFLEIAIAAYDHIIF